MPTFAKIDNGAVAQYPYQLGDLMADHPNTSFPIPLTPDDVEPFGVVVVEPLAKPIATVYQVVAEAPPVPVDGVWTQQWVVTAAAPEEVATRIQQLVTSIDAACAAVYAAPARFADEYKLREAQAQAYKDAGYTGPVPRQVAAYATPAGVTAQQAADTILAQAAALRGALDALGELRMRKIELATAPDPAATHAEILAAIQAIAATL